MLSALSRRHLLQVLAVGAASTAGGLCACSGASGDPEPFGDVTAGKLADLELNTLQQIPGAPAFIARDAGGLYAMTTTCSHEGCDLSDGIRTASSVTCRCHRSQFDLNGAVLSGPASSPLAHFQVELGSDGTITVHGATKVDASVRTPAA
jgi:nitrite reductase/ring-hydroxylating ferredoxin subunit